MVEDQLYSVSESVAVAAEPVTLQDVGLKERQHLQEWVIKYPAILGPEVLVVTVELGSWISSTGAVEKDRLDVLGLDASGQLVVAELKRGAAPDSVTMQAIKYAGLANRFNVERLVQQYARFLTDRDKIPVDPDDARARLLEHAPDLADDSLGPPRIVLLAGEFGPLVTSAAVYLREAGLDITLVTIRPFRTSAGEVVVSVTQLFPIRDLDDLTMVASPITQKKESEQKAKQAKAVTRLFAANAIPDGTQFTFANAAKSTSQWAAAVQEWIEEDPSRGRAVWKAHPSRPLVWEIDGKQYAPSTLVGKISEEAIGEQPKGIWGTGYWFDSLGRSISELAAKLNTIGDTPART